jgi:cytochrome c556
VRKLPFLIGAAVALAGAAYAAEDPVAVRQALMDANAGAAGVSGAMLKDELAYSPVVAKAAILTLNAVAHSVGDFFPEGTAGPENKSDASPKIWEDAAGFEAALAKFAEAASAAAEAAGKDGPADKAAFQAAVQPVLGTCKTCHDTFRIPD